MCKFILVLFLYAVQIKYLNGSAEPWVPLARVVAPIPYFSEVMQELVQEMERREWCNLKMVTVNKNVNTFIANWNVTGSVTYTNGFVVSIQRIDVHQVSGAVSRHVENNITIPRASVTGRLMFHDVNIGYDVLANLTDIGEQRYTGEILNTHITLQFQILKDLITEKITTFSSYFSIQGPNIRMIYRPANHITEVLSRDFISSDNANGVMSWLPDLNSILMEIATHKINFPKICFNNC